MASVVSDLSVEILRTVIMKLSPDEKEKGYMLTGKAEHFEIDGPERKNLDHVVMNIEYWTEVVFILQRYDLLKLIRVSEKDAFEQVEDRSYFPITRRLLVKMYDAISESSEKEFCSRIWKELYPSEESAALPLTKTLLRVEKSIHADGCSKLKKLLMSMSLTEAVKELDRYCNDIKKASSKVNLYPMERSPCGKCLIINNYNVKGEPVREGSEIDSRLLKETFQNFDFKVEFHEDLNFDKMLEVLNNAAKEDHSNLCAFVCCIMSHGHNGSIYSADGEELKISDIRMMFCRCQTLKGKPKIFFYQACRGQNFQRGDATLMTDGPTKKAIIEDSLKDCLIGMATVEGNVAFRNSKEGSYFVRSLVNGLKEAEKLSGVQILVNAEVSKIQVPYAGQIISQTPEWVNTLTRDLIFKKICA